MDRYTKSVLTIIKTFASVVVSINGQMVIAGLLALGFFLSLIWLVLQ